MGVLCAFDPGFAASCFNLLEMTGIESLNPVPGGQSVRILWYQAPCTHELQVPLRGSSYQSQRRPFFLSSIESTTLRRLSKTSFRKVDSCRPLRSR